MDSIHSFDGPYRWLSNFWLCNVGGYASVEHAYQAMKTMDYDWRTRISNCATPGEAKKLGRLVPMRPDWNKIKLEIMYNLVLEKFNLNHDLAEKLRATKDAQLIEGNWWGDKFWGVDNRTSTGHNHLGKILMRVREKIK